MRINLPSDHAGPMICAEIGSPAAKPIGTARDGSPTTLIGCRRFETCGGLSTNHILINKLYAVTHICEAWISPFDSIFDSNPRGLEWTRAPIRWQHRPGLWGGESPRPWWAVPKPTVVGTTRPHGILPHVYAASGRCLTVTRRLCYNRSVSILPV